MCLFLWQPENILCVNRDAKQIKIIDFGLARRYVHLDVSTGIEVRDGSFILYKDYLTCPRSHAFIES